MIFTGNLRIKFKEGFPKRYQIVGQGAVNLSAVKVGGQKKIRHFWFKATFYYAHLLQAYTFLLQANIFYT